MRTITRLWDVLRCCGCSLSGSPPGPAVSRRRRPERRPGRCSEADSTEGRRERRAGRWRHGAALGRVSRRCRTRRHLIRAGADVKAANSEGVTPLSMAALYGNAAMIDRLIKAGADAKQRGPNGETMVMLAARNGNPQAVTVLLEAGADVNAREPIRGTTALMWAVEQKHPRP